MIIFYKVIVFAIIFSLKFIAVSILSISITITKCYKIIRIICTQCILKIIFITNILTKLIIFPRYEVIMSITSYADSMLHY